MASLISFYPASAQHCRDTVIYENIGYNTILIYSTVYDLYMYLAYTQQLTSLAIQYMIYIYIYPWLGTKDSNWTASSIPGEKKYASLYIYFNISLVSYITTNIEKNGDEDKKCVIFWFGSNPS